MAHQRPPLLASRPGTLARWFNLVSHQHSRIQTKDVPASPFLTNPLPPLIVLCLYSNTSPAAPIARILCQLYQEPPARVLSSLALRHLVIAVNRVPACKPASLSSSSPPPSELTRHSDEQDIQSTQALPPAQRASCIRSGDLPLPEDPPARLRGPSLFAGTLRAPTQLVWSIPLFCFSRFNPSWHNSKRLFK